MIARLDTGLLVQALVRRVHAAGGSAMVLARGDAGAGAVVFVTLDRGAGAAAWERGWDAEGKAALVATGPRDDSAALDQYLARRRDRDRDLWIVELDIADPKRFIAETFVND